MVLKDLRMVCEIGENTPALRAKNVDMYLNTVKFLKVEDMEGTSSIEDNIDEIEAIDLEEEDEEEEE